MASDLSSTAEAMAYALRLDAYAVKIVVDSTWKLARRKYRSEVVKLIEKEIATSSDTRYAKGQKIALKRIIDKLGRG